MKSTFGVDFSTSSGSCETARAGFLGDRACLHDVCAGRGASYCQDRAIFAGGEEGFGTSCGDLLTAGFQTHIPPRSAMRALR